MRLDFRRHFPYFCLVNGRSDGKNHAADPSFIFLLFLYFLGDEINIPKRYEVMQRIIFMQTSSCTMPLFGRKLRSKHGIRIHIAGRITESNTFIFK